MQLAREWGVTPAQWRATATDEDWATAFHLLEREAEQIDEHRSGR